LFIALNTSSFISQHSVLRYVYRITLRYQQLTFAEMCFAEAEVEPAQIFISYQWDNQDEVTVLRDVLEKNGFTCWMDIGQMGGGDYLYNCIYDGIKNAKVSLQLQEYRPQ